MQLAKNDDLPIVFRSFHVRSIGEMLKKLEWEIARLKADQLSIEPYSACALRESSYGAINAAITAFHVSDWIWAVATEDKKSEWLAGYSHTEKSKKNKTLFQKMLKEMCPSFSICRGIANSAKHLVDDKNSEFSVRNGKSRHLTAPAVAGSFRAGEPLIQYETQLVIMHYEVEHIMTDVLVRTYEFFDRFCVENGLMEDILL